MSDWSEGYVTEVDYTYGYYVELNPRRATLALLASGVAPGPMATACELGFGQGLSINMHAAGSAMRWWGTDFNPSQAAFARTLAESNGANIQLFDEAFEQFCRRNDLPEFDYIGLHGIWSWINDANRQHIVDLLQRRLKVGGTLYISYNAYPGWSAAAPLRHLMVQHDAIMSAPGQGAAKRVDDALGFIEKLIDTNPLYARANPGMKERLNRIKSLNRNYLAHEYFNQDWHPMPFAQVAQWLSPAKLSYVCSAHFLDHVDALNLSAEQQKFMAEIPDPMFRQTVRDYMVNQQFRRDYWVKGPRKLSGMDQVGALRQQRLMLVTPRADVPLKAAGAQGEAQLQAPIYEPILDLLADHQPHTLAQIEQAVQGKNINLSQVVQAALVLTGAGHVHVAQDDAAIHKARKNCIELNARLTSLAAGNAAVAFVASPVTGGGIPLARFQQMFLDARVHGRKLASELATYVWSIISAHGQRIVKDGKTLESADDNLAELTRQAEEFLQKQVPVLKGLGIA